MSNENKQETFSYTYSARQQEEIKAIRARYMPKEEDKMTQLRNLDARVTQKAMSAGLTIGVLSCLLLGIGMCCTMVWSDRPFLPGILIGLVGIIGIAAAYPLYSRITKREREKIAPQIIKLTDELMK